MGTRATFWVGDPRDVAHREYLGAIGWDGYPDGLLLIRAVTSERGLRRAVERMAAERDDFASPERGFAFPWVGDIFLTDYTYAFFDNAMHVSHNHRGLEPLAEFVDQDTDPPPPDDPSCVGVPAPGPWQGLERDNSILTFRPS